MESKLDLAVLMLANVHLCFRPISSDLFDMVIHPNKPMKSEIPADLRSLTRSDVLNTGIVINQQSSSDT